MKNFILFLVILLGIFNANAQTCSFSFINYNGSSFLFTNQSTSVLNGVDDSIKYDFGDGVVITYPISFSQIGHSYLMAGTYLVCATIYGHDTVTMIPYSCNFCDSVINTNIGGCNCVSTFSKTVSGNIVSLTNNSVCNMPFQMWNWLFGDGTFGSNFNEVHSYSQPGIYTICFYVQATTQGSGFCDDIFCDTVIVNNLPTSIQNTDDKNNHLDLFPNPTNSLINISATNLDKIYIKDMVGKTIVTFPNNIKTIDISNLKCGMYLIILVSNESTKAYRIIKN